MNLRARANKTAAENNWANALTICVIHNLRGIKTLEDAKSAIKRDIEDVFLNV